MMQSRRIVVIEAGQSAGRYWREVLSYRELFFALAWRDISVRYKQTTIGLMWALIQPILTLVVFTVIFSKVAQLRSDGESPYVLLVFAALLPWQFFSAALSGASVSLIGNASLVSKVYFPRLIVPLASIGVSLVDFLVSFVVLFALMLWYQFSPSWNAVLLPWFVLMAFLASLGPSFLIAALNVKYRDFRYVVPFMLQLGLYVSPVGFSTNLIPEQWRLLYSLNPMVGVIDGFRWVLLGDQSPIYLPGQIASWCVILFLLWGGVRYFRSVESGIADLI